MFRVWGSFFRSGYFGFFTQHCACLFVSYCAFENFILLRAEYSKLKMSGCCCYDVVSTSEVGVIERMGKFNRLAEVSSVGDNSSNRGQQFCLIIRRDVFGFVVHLNMLLERFH
jgi:hypothetical protein